MKSTAHIADICSIIIDTYPDTRPLLDFEGPYQLLIAVIMSAQTTDNQVNKITPDLFSAYPEPVDLAAAEVGDIEEIIKSTGFYRQKAKNIKKTARVLVDLHGGEVPESMDALVKLPGVGRKTANVVLGHYFGHPAIIVDTHFSRVCRRLGLTVLEDPVKIERDVKAQVPDAIQTAFSMAANRHGRYCCKARNPLCGECPVTSYCDFYGDNS